MLAEIGVDSNKVKLEVVDGKIQITSADAGQEE